MFITAEVYDSKTSATHSQTWFYDAQRNFECHLPARRVGDSPDGRAMIFATDDRRVVTLAPDFRVVKTVRYLAGGRALAPRELFADLSLGLFADGKRLVLAGWSAKGR